MKTAVGILLTLLTTLAHAANSGVTYQGRILRPDGAPLAGQFTQFKMQIRTPDAQGCLMYEEIQSQDLRNSSGAFSLTINDGSGSRTDSTGLTLDRIFANRGTYTLDVTTCSTGTGVWAPNVSDGRNLVVLFKDETMASWEPIPAQKINFVPFAFESKQIAGFTADSLIRVVNGSGDPLTGLAPLSNAQYTELMALVNGTSTAFTKSGQLGGVALPTMSTGEVLGWNGSAWVSQPAVAGANSVSTTMIQNNAVDSSKIASGAVGTSQVAGNVTINTSGTLGAAITTTRDFKIFAASPSLLYIDMQAPALTASYSLVWPMTAGSSGQVLTTDGTGVLSWAPAGSPSQWTTQAPGINYMGGNVGIGTTAPIGPLDVKGASGHLSVTAAGSVGVGNPTPLGTFAASALSYSAGTASQSGTTLTGVGTVWTAAMIGSHFTFADGTSAGTIIGRSSNTSITVETSQTVASQNYGIYVPGLQVYSNGYVGISAGGNTFRNTAPYSQPVAPLQIAGSGTLIALGGASSWNANIGVNGVGGLTYSGSNSGFGITHTIQGGGYAVNLTGAGGNFAVQKSGTTFLYGEQSTGNVGIGTTAPTARLQLASGTAAAGTAPLKLTTGTLMTTPEDGAMEYNSGSGLWFTIGSTRYVIPTNTAAGNYSNVTNISNSGGTITMTPSAGNSLFVNQSTTSTNSSSGALVVTGGAGIGGALNTGGNITSGGSITATTNAVIPQIYGSTSANGFIKIDGTSNATTGNVLLAAAGGSVGIGTTSPVEALEVNGAIKLGTTAGANAGTLRWSGSNFQGYDGVSWFNIMPNPPAAGGCDQTQSFTSAGNYGYTVPSGFATITVKLWGGGGGGGAGWNANGGAGGTSSIASLSLSAGGGNGGLGGALGRTGGSGGSGAGGSTNTSGSSGGNGGGVSVPSGSGASAPFGGTGGGNCPGVANAVGSLGGAPGGGGGGGCDNGGNESGGGGGSGAYVVKTFTSATLSAGTTINDIVVGAGGTGGSSTGYGAGGGSGRVSITCSTTGAPPLNNRAILFLDSGAYTSDSNLVYSTTGNVGIGTTSPTVALDMSGKTDAISLPSGTTAQRPASPVNGMARFNTTIGKMEFYDGGQWVSYLTQVNATAPAGTGGTGYFVLSNTQWDGNLGGLAGANAKCRTELSTFNWKNKPGVLDTSKVFAFLCDKSSCQTPQALVNYYYATANDTSMGGSGFSTDGSGAGPGDRFAMTATDRFGPAGSSYWVGTRSYGDDKWATNGLSNYLDCATWSSNSSSDQANKGNGTSPDIYRFTGYPGQSNETCDIPHKLICFVNP
jgi:hypothetical protein